MPPSWWQRAANDVQFLGNRHPPYSLDANVPLDGDMASPIERMFLGYVSHHQVYREIDCFVAVGTPNETRNTNMNEEIENRHVVVGRLPLV